MEELNFLKTDYSLDKEFSNDKFLKLRLKICHDGENKSNTSFTYDSINNAKESLSMIPILANIVKDENDEYQFGDHDIVLEQNAFDKNNIKEIFIERIIGFIPNIENCNYEVVREDNKNYVYTDGYIWKKYSNYAEDIINRDKIINLSMEVDVNSFTSQKDKNNQMQCIVSDYSYKGITLLGNDVEPAMYGACAMQVNTFSLKDNPKAKDIISIMSNELNAIFENEKGGLMMSLDTNNGTQNNQQIINQEPITNDTFDIQRNFSKNITKLEREIMGFLDDNYYTEDTWANLIYLYDDKFIYSIISWSSGRRAENFYMQKYSFENDVMTTTSEPVEVFCEFLTAEERDNLQQIKNTFSENCKQLEELRNFKEKTIAEQENTAKQEIFSKWSFLKDNEEYKNLQSNSLNFSKEDIETKCKCIFADVQLEKEHKEKNNTQKEQPVVNYSFVDSTQKEPKSRLDCFMSEFGK